MTQEKIMRDQFECLLNNPAEPRFAELRDILLRPEFQDVILRPELRHVLLLPFEEHAPAPTRATAMGG